MTRYSDILNLVGALLVFSMLSMLVARLIFFSNLTRMESTAEYHVASHAHQYADLIQSIQTEDDLYKFLDDFPRVDSVAYDKNDPSAFFKCRVGIESADTTLPNSTVTNKVVLISMNNLFLEKRNPSKTYQLKLVKSFNN